MGGGVTAGPDAARCRMSDPHFSRRMPADPTRFILVGTSHAGNVGATARAIKVMGFSDLVLVAPRYADVLERPEAIARASGATDVLAGARIAASLGEALDGITCVCATAMTPRDFGPPNRAPRELFATLARQGQRVAFVFGSERFGLANDDVYACHACLTIPTDPRLRIAQSGPGGAVDRLRLAPGAGRIRRAAAVARPRTWPTPSRCAAWSATGRHALETIGFLDPAAPKKLMARLQRLANRAQLTAEEVHILRGIARAIDERCR